MIPRTRLLLIFGLLIVLTVAVNLWRHTRVESRHDAIILAAAQRHSIDPALVKAVIWRESGFDASARGTKGEIGLMQILPRAAGIEWAQAKKVAGFTEATLVNPRANVDCGAWYLAKLLARYRATDNPIAFALADYNAGRSNVLKWMAGAGSTNSEIFVQQITFGSTQRYVRAVMRRKVRYDSWAARQQTKKILVRQTHGLGDVSPGTETHLGYESASASEVVRDSVRHTTCRAHQSFGG
jgi:soluble lytic murein transglycosylase